MLYTFSCLKTYYYCCIFDEMAKLQEVKAVPTFTFHADTFLTEIILAAHSYFSCRIDFFCDLFRNHLKEYGEIKAF